MIELKKKEVFQELDLIVDGVKIGEAEVDIQGKMLARLSIFEPYQDKGYGTRIVQMLVEEYGLDNLWVRSDNKKAIHVYEKCGFKKSKETMFEMRRR